MDTTAAISDVALGGEIITGRVTLDGLEKLLPAKRVEQVEKAGIAERAFVTAAVSDPQPAPDLERAGVLAASPGYQQSPITET